MGRSREFNLPATLDAAIRTFWQNGYHGTSIADVVECTKVAPKGLYAAFGNKEALFESCIDRYMSVHLAFFEEALTADSGSEMLQRILEGYTRLVTYSPEHPGCMALNSMLGSSDAMEGVRAGLASRLRSLETRLAARLQACSEPGCCRTAKQAIRTARLVMTFVSGLAAQAKSGLKRSDLIDLAIAFHESLCAPAATGAALREPAYITSSSRL